MESGGREKGEWGEERTPKAGGPGRGERRTHAGEVRLQSYCESVCVRAVWKYLILSPSGLTTPLRGGSSHLPLAERRKLRCEEIKSLVQGHRLGDGQRQESKPVSLHCHPPLRNSRLLSSGTVWGEYPRLSETAPTTRRCGARADTRESPGRAAPAASQE